MSYTQRNIFGILLNQTEIRLYSRFSDWFGTKRTSVRYYTNQKMVNTIWFQFDVIRFGKYLPACRVNWANIRASMLIICMFLAWERSACVAFLVTRCTEKTIFPFPFKSNGLWSWWQFSFRFSTIWKSIWFKIKGRLSARSYLIQFERKWKYSFFQCEAEFWDKNDTVRQLSLCSSQIEDIRQVF